MQLVDVAYIVTNLSGEDNEGFLELSRIPVKGEYIMIQADDDSVNFLVEDVFHTPLAEHHRGIINIKAM